MNDVKVSDKQGTQNEDREILSRGLTALAMASLFSTALSTSFVYPSAAESDNTEKSSTENSK